MSEANGLTPATIAKRLPAGGRCGVESRGRRREQLVRQSRLVVHIGAVGGTRTRDRRFRKPLLYPAELPPQKAVGTGNLREEERQGKTALDSLRCEPTFRGLSPHGVVAQLVRASACHAEGRGFESRPSRQVENPLILKVSGFSVSKTCVTGNETGNDAINAHSRSLL